MTCTKCGGEGGPTGACSKCGYNEAVDLEIAAFMTPHINRARIVLVVVGLLYAYLGFRSYGDLADLREAINRYAGPHDADLETLRSTVNIAFAIVIYVIVA